jgi:ssDNA-binding Zn-finger/Zn-ribbon topoisomerase 1
MNLKCLKGEDSSLIKCPKCGHESKFDPGWIKASAMIGCPKCSTSLRVRESETD